MYLVDFSKETTHIATGLIAKSDVGWLWHRRLGHVGMRNLQTLVKGEHMEGLTKVIFSKIVLVDLAFPERCMRRTIPRYQASTQRGPSNSFIWTCLGLLHMIALGVRSIASMKQPVIA